VDDSVLKPGRPPIGLAPVTSSRQGSRYGF
jgi:hypothetical protein